MKNYNALSVARHIIKVFDQKDETISNLKLQKLLYFAWINYYKEKKCYLFSQAFEAWRFGPVIPEVYYEYSTFGCLPIMLDAIEYEGSENEILAKDAEILERTISAYLDKSVFEMVEETHKSDGAWAAIYSGNPRDKKEIPFHIIIDKECRDV